MKRSLVMVLIGLGVTLTVAVSLGFYWPFSHENGGLTLPGTVEVHELRLGSKVGGRVAEVFVREGDTVDEGKPLVRFDAPELKAQREQLAQRLAAAKAELEKAESGPRPQEKDEARWAKAAAEQRKKRADAGWRDEEIEQAKDDWEAADADRESAQKNFERMQKIRDVSPNESDNAQSRYTFTLRKANAARTKFKMMKSGNREEDKQEAGAEFERARAHSDLLDLGNRREDKDVARAQAAEIQAKLDEIDANLKETVVLAPSRLVVEVLSVRKGDLVPPNQSVVRALLAEERWVKIFAPQNELGAVHVGDAAEVTCDTFPNKKFKGTVVQIATASEFTPRNVQSADERRHQVFAVKVRVDDGGEVFKSGMAAEVRLAPQGAK